MMAPCGTPAFISVGKKVVEPMRTKKSNLRGIFLIYNF